MATRSVSWWMLAAVLMVLSVFVYLPTFQAGFVDFDDSAYVHGNEHVASGLSAENVQWAFTKYHASNWHPLTWISHMLDVEMFGLDPRFHHVVNVVLHVVNVLLLFFIVAAITGETLAAFVVAALFAVHPVNVESVAWISQRKTLLSTLFALLTIWTYFRYVRLADRRMYFVSLGLFALSLMSKQMMVTMPFALLLLDYWPLERKELEPPKGQLPSVASLLRGWWKLFPEKLPYLAVAVLAGVMTLITQQDAMNSVESYPLSVRLGNVSISYVRYLVSLVWPIHLAVFYPLYHDEITATRVVGSILILVALTALAIWLGRRYRWLLVGWFWFLGTMVPVIGIVHVGAQSMADRYAYVPFWGLFIAIVWWALTLFRGYLTDPAASRGVGVGVVVAAILAVLSMLTFQQAGKWRDTIALFDDAVQDAPRNWLAHRVLADHYLESGDYKQAAYHGEQGRQYHRELDRLLSTYGRALFELGHRDQALQALEQAVQADPEKSLPYTNLGWVQSELGRYDEAIQNFAHAADKLPADATPYARRTVYANWAMTLAKSGRLRDAREKFELALATEPDSGQLLSDTAGLDLALHEPRRAIERLSRAIQLDPRDAQAIYLLGRAYLADDRPSEAAEALQRSLRLNGQNLDAIVQLSKALAQLGRAAEARKLLDDVLASVDKSPDKNAQAIASLVRTHLGEIAVTQRQTQQAVDLYRRALAQWPDNQLAANNLAWLLATSADAKRRDPKRALELATRAAEQSGRKDATILATLAAAQAANAQTKEAAATARAALDLAQQANDQRSAAKIAEQLKRYEQGQPYIEAPAPR